LWASKEETKAFISPYIATGIEKDTPLAFQSRGYVLAYDASCGPCSGFKAAVGFLDARHRIQFVSLEEAEKSGLLAEIAPDSRFASFHLMVPHPSRVADGSLWSGSKAILPLMRLLPPWGRMLSRIVETIPVGATAVSHAYSAFSKLHRGCRPRLKGEPFGGSHYEGE
jgi:predicted DCC family thiol-disulfide oxidoreductase YuxK